MDNQEGVFLSALNAVCADWNESSSSNWGFKLSVELESVQRAHSLWHDILDKNPAFPPHPGPFKCAAAYLVVAWSEVEFIFNPNANSELFTDEQKRIWKSRFLFKSLPLILKQWTLSRDSKSIALNKDWDVPTVHYRLDFLNFLRWTELPLEGPAKPPPPSHVQINVVRTNRLIMALALTIEACYYLAGNVEKLDCDIINNAVIRPDDLHQDIEPDLYFDFDTSVL